MIQAKTGKSLIIAANDDADYYAIILTLAKRLENAGQEFEILDLTQALPVPTENYHSAFLKFAGYRTPRSNFYSSISTAKYNLQIFRRNKKSSAPNLQSSLVEKISHATESACMTYFRTEELSDFGIRYKRLKKDLFSSSLQIAAYLQENYIDTVRTIYLPNGRFPHQAAVEFCALQNNLQVFYYERGMASNKYFCKPHSTLDRVNTQQDVDLVLKSLSREEISNIADAWLEARRPSSINGTNEFSRHWRKGSLPLEIDERKRSGKLFGIYTSSQDEYLSLGPAWELDNWDSQWNAFHEALTMLDSMGVSSYIRVHPNLLTKSRKSYKRTLSEVRKLKRSHPNLFVIWHYEDVDTYSLLESSSGVIVWNSTVGLEASAMAIPVWALSATFYGETAQVTNLFGPESISEETFVAKKSDSFPAKRYITYLIKRDDNLAIHPQDFFSWNPEIAPPLVLLARLLRSGGYPSLLETALSIIEPLYRLALTRLCSRFLGRLSWYFQK